MTTQDPSNEGAAASGSSPTRRRWMKLIIGLIVINVVVFGGILYYLVEAREAIEAIPTTSIPSLGREPEPESPVVTDPPDTTIPANPGTPAVEEAPAELLAPVTFLVIGSDTREGLPEELEINDRLDGNRADVIMLATLDGDTARVLSLPRDLQVDLDGYGVVKLNAALALGGGDLMVSTVEELTGVQIDHYVEMDFYGFASIVDALGGVEITFAYPARDLKSGLDVDAGVQLLDGKEALAYARSRGYQERRGNAWVSIDANDLGRIRRQQSLLFAMLESAKRWTIVFDIPAVLRAAGEHLVIDAGLDAQRLLELGWAARNLHRGDIEVYSLPVWESTEDGVYYLHPSEPAATEVVAAFAGADASSGAPEQEQELRLKVLNGNGGDEQASMWAAWFEGREGVSGPVGVGDAASFDFNNTVVRVRPYDHEIGRQVVEMLGFGLVEAGSVDDSLDAVVILGADALAAEAVLGG
ncbi:MAG: LCP family protein [bacterium]|nr:LCP family protein [bacterium]MYB44748.1 LytR family transcriptional regulator [Acidimicrobiia bacterium]